MITSDSYLQLDIGEHNNGIQLPMKKYDELTPIVKELVYGIFDKIYHKDEETGVETIDESRPFIAYHGMELPPIMHPNRVGKYAPYNLDRIEDCVTLGYHLIVCAATMIHRCALVHVPKDAAKVPIFFMLNEVLMSSNLGEKTTILPYPYVFGTYTELPIIPPSWPNLFCDADYIFTWTALIQRIRHNISVNRLYDRFFSTSYDISRVIGDYYFKKWVGTSCIWRTDVITTILVQFALSPQGAYPEMRDQFWVTLANITEKLLNQPERVNIKMITEMRKQIKASDSIHLTDDLLEMINNDDNRVLDKNWN